MHRCRRQEGILLLLFILIIKSSVVYVTNGDSNWTTLKLARKSKFELIRERLHLCVYCIKPNSLIRSEVSNSYPKADNDEPIYDIFRQMKVLARRAYANCITFLQRKKKIIIKVEKKPHNE